MSLLSSDETTFSYEVDEEEGQTTVEWRYKRNPVRKLLGWSPKLMDVELESERRYEEGQEEREHSITNWNVGGNCKYSYSISRSEEGNSPDAEEVVSLHPRAVLSDRFAPKNHNREFNSEIRNINSEDEPIEVTLDSEITDGSGTVPLHSGKGVLEEEGTVRYELSGHDDAYTDIRSYVSDLMTYLDLEEDQLTPPEGLATEEMEANTLVEDTWRDLRQILGETADTVSEGVNNSLSTLSRDAKTYWHRLVTDEVIDGYNLKPEEFLEFLEECNDALVEEIEYSNAYHPIQKKSRTSETFETVRSDPELRLMPENLEVIEKEAVDGVEYHGKVFFDTASGEMTTGDTDWVTSGEPDIEIRVKTPEDYKFSTLEKENEPEKALITEEN